MYKTCLLVLLVIAVCVAMPRKRRSAWAKRSSLLGSPNDTSDDTVVYEILANQMFLQANENPTTGLSATDVENFFLFLGKSPIMSRNFGEDYIFWGDQNGDHRLNREELLRAMRIHKITDYI